MIKSFILFYYFQKSFFASKILFCGNKLDLKADLSRTGAGNLNLQMEQLNDSKIPAWSSFPGAIYSNITIKQSYKIALLPRMMNARRLRKMADTIQLYLQCFENPYTLAGCRLPRTSCNSKISKSISTSKITIEMLESSNSFKLQCIGGTRGDPGNRLRRSPSFILNCCPREKNIICHGCEKVPIGGTHVQVSLCPKGFVCLGKLPVGNRGGRSGRKSMARSEKYINITIKSRRLLYRYRRETEKLNTVEELKSLYDLMIIKKALQVIANDFPNFV